MQTGGNDEIIGSFSRLFEHAYHENEPSVSINGEVFID
jgi:hypothetical protein